MYGQAYFEWNFDPEIPRESVFDLPFLYPPQKNAISSLLPAQADHFRFVRPAWPIRICETPPCFGGPLMFRPTHDPDREVMIIPKTELQRIAALEAMVARMQERVARLERKTQEDEG